MQGPWPTERPLGCSFANSWPAAVPPTCTVATPASFPQMVFLAAEASKILEDWLSDGEDVSGALRKQPAVPPTSPGFPACSALPAHASSSHSHTTTVCVLAAGHEHVRTEQVSKPQVQKEPWEHLLAQPQALAPVPMASLSRPWSQSQPGVQPSHAPGLSCPGLQALRTGLSCPHTAPALFSQQTGSRKPGCRDTRCQGLRAGPGQGPSMGTQVDTRNALVLAKQQALARRCCLAAQEGSAQAVIRCWVSGATEHFLLPC